MIYSSLSVTVFIFHPKCGANFPPRKKKRKAWDDCYTCTLGSRRHATLFSIRLSTTLRLIVSSQLNSSYRRCCSGTLCFKHQFYCQGLSFKNKVTCFLYSIENLRSQSSLPGPSLLSLLKLQGLSVRSSRCHMNNRF